MLKIQQIIMSKKFLPVLLVLTVGSLFVAFQTQGRGDDNPKTKNEKILRNVGLLLEQGHYSPKEINDSFSKQVLNRFLKDLDGDKSIFLQSDIDSFAKYANRIDDEIHGAKLESFYTINDSYTRRLNQASQYFDDMLSKPFDFTKEENVILDGDKLKYPSTEADKKEAWRKRLKYLVLSKYVEMMDEREINKNKKQTGTAKDSVGTEGKVTKKFVYKADSTLEREARELVKKQINRYFTTLKTHNTNDELFSSFVNAITGEMDPHSNYFAPVDSRGFNEMMSGKFYGIGAQLKEDESKIKIASLITGMPAWKSGELGINDEIIRIGQGNAEPVDVTGYAVADAVKLIRGSEANTEVRLTVRKPDGNIKVVILKRGEIKLEDTFAKSAIINGLHKIGYIYLPEFYMDFEKPNGAKCSEDVAKEIVKLKAENVEGIVMDLRGNGLFIEDGPICQVRGRDEKQPYLWKDRDKSILYSGPLTVMVDEGSASASEIFAAAIQDYKRGIIIGSTSTYGKGTVQRTIPLNPEAENPAFAKTSEDLGTVKLTLQKFYRINGGATQLKGVTPDVVIPDRFEYYKSREKDNDAALSWDEIGKAEYKPWVSTYSASTVISSANDQVNTSNTFKEMKQEIQFIDKLNDKEYSLNLNKYKEEQNQLKVAYKKLDSLYKLPKDLNVTSNPLDTAGISTDKEKMERNKQFLSRLKGDVYIDETVKVMNNMINQSNLALNGATTTDSLRK
jgi:carboxyl-terminal processing protease